MIIYADGNGKILNAVQERVFQGAAGSYRLGLVSPFPETDAVTASFTLSGGKTCPPSFYQPTFPFRVSATTTARPLVVRQCALSFARAFRTRQSQSAVPRAL